MVSFGLFRFRINKENLKKIGDCEFSSTAVGSSNYSVYLNVSHPRKSSCNCPLANGKKIICKHIVATMMEFSTNSQYVFFLPFLQHLETPRF